MNDVDKLIGRIDPQLIEKGSFYKAECPYSDCVFSCKTKVLGSGRLTAERIVHQALEKHIHAQHTETEEQHKQ